MSKLRWSVWGEQLQKPYQEQRRDGEGALWIESMDKGQSHVDEKLRCQT